MDIKIQPKITTITTTMSWGHFKFKSVSSWDWNYSDLLLPR